MNDALRPDVHEAARGHLAVAGHTQGRQLVVLLTAGVVGNDHPVGQDHSWRVRARREQAHGVTRVQDQGLVAAHVRQVLHGQQVLSPVLEHGAVAAVGDQLVRELSHLRIQVVLDHVHDGLGLITETGVLLDRASVHLVVWPEAHHVDAAVGLELLEELWGQRLVPLHGEVAQGVGQGHADLSRGQDLGHLRTRRRVRHTLVQGTGLRKFSRDTGHDGLFEGGESRHGHIPRGEGVDCRRTDLDYYF